MRSLFVISVAPVRFLFWPYLFSLALSPCPLIRFCSANKMCAMGIERRVHGTRVIEGLNKGKSAECALSREKTVSVQMHKPISNVETCNNIIYYSFPMESFTMAVRMCSGILPVCMQIAPIFAPPPSVCPLPSSVAAQASKEI